MRTGMILCSFLLASIAWALAWAEGENQSNGVTITSDLSQALVNQETVYSVTTTKGSIADNTMVRVTVTADEGTDLSSLSFWYYEPNGTKTGWNTWNPVSEGFGPSAGFPLIDGTSYFKVQPTKEGEYTYTMSVKTVEDSPKTLATATCTVNAVETLTVPYASITTNGESGNVTVNYASIPEAVLFAQENATIQLSQGDFVLSKPLEITKAITLQGSRDGNNNIVTVLKPVTDENNFKTDASTHKNLVTVSGGETGKMVNLNYLKIESSYGSGLNVQTAMNTVINGMKIENCEHAGMLVHSQVEASVLETQNNKWGGVNIDKGSTNYDRLLTIKGNGYNFKENAKIWAEKADCPDPQALVVFEPENNDRWIYDWQIVQGRGGSPEKDMIYWVTTNKPKDGSYQTAFSSYLTSTTKNSVTTYDTHFFANGNPVTVTAEGQYFTKIAASSEDYIILPYGNRVSLYGGSMNTEVASTSITMNSGKLLQIYGGGYTTTAEAHVTGNVSIAMTGGSVPYVFGGGYGKTTYNSSTKAYEGYQADVQGKTTINISGGTIAGILTAGGQYFAKSGEVEMTVTGAQTSLGWVLGGGFDAGQTTNTIDTEFDQSVNGTSKTTMSITGASASIICAGGGQGISYSKEVEATLNNVKISGGLLGTGSNGRSDNVTITAKGCTFDKGSGTDPIEIAAVNRGRVEKITINIDGCTFSGTAEDYYAYAGATYNWSSSGSQKNDAHNITGSVTWNFKNNNHIPFIFGLSDGLDGNLTVNNLPVTLAPFKGNASSTATTNFTVPAGKTWNFNSGLEIVTGENGEATASLTKSGTLNVRVYNDAQRDASGPYFKGDNLQAILDLGADTVILAPAPYKLTKQLTVDKTKALIGDFIPVANGDSTRICFADSYIGTTEQGNKHVIGISQNNNNVLLQNLVVDGTIKSAAEGTQAGSGINVYCATGVKLDNVISRNNRAAGLIVNGSTVTAENFTTYGNGWYYGVNVDKGDGVDGTPVFTVGKNCSFLDAVAIKSDLADAPASYVSSSDWIKKIQTVESKTFTTWVNAASQGINYAIISVPATVVYGEANLPLLSNITPDAPKTVTFAVTEGSESVEIETIDGKQTLKIKKPGKAMLSLEYDGVTVTQAVEVLKRTISVSGITAVDKTYDGTTDVTLNTKNAQATGAVDGDNLTFTYSGTLKSEDAGDAVPVEITATASGMTNFDDYYTVAVAPVTAKVSKAELTVTTQTITEINYNGTMPPFYVNYSGFVNGETAAVLDGTLQFDCPATSTSLANDYTVTPYGLTSNNYAIKYEGTTLTIKAVAPTVEIVSATVSDNKSTVTVKGHVTNNGGTKTTELKGGFKVGDTEKVSGLTVDKDGYFSADLTNLGNEQINLKATATATISESQSLTGTSTTDFNVNLALNPQNVRFVTNLSRLVYGSKVTLDAADYAEGATVTYSVEGNALKLDETDRKTITAAEPGTATITVTATKVGYITATAKQTVVVEPKAITYKPSPITKSYDGKLEVNVNCSLEGIVGNDDVQMDIDNVKYRFLDKNVGENKPVVISEPLKIKGDAKSCYTVIQPTNWTGSITSGGNVTVTVSDVHRKHNESALHYSLSFTANGQPIKPIYTGSITVTENNDGTWTASLDNVNFPNYGKASLVPESGTVEIEKGTPKVLTHHDANGNVTGSVVDTEGWTDVTADGTGTDTNGTFAKFTYDRGSKSVRGVSLSRVTFNAHDWNISDEMRSARMLRAGSDAERITFGQKKVLTKVTDFTYSVSNPAVVTLTERDANSYYINAVGVGDGAIIATHTGGTVVYKQIHVNPAELTISASNADKTYDGTTVANPSLAINGTAPAGVALDLTGISFNYASANAADNVAIHPTQPIALTGANAANYQVSTSNMTGKINARELTVTSPISKYYDGSATLTLTDYNATGLLVGEAAPAITVTFQNGDGAADANVGTNKSLTFGALSGNYKLATTGNPETGNIVRSTIDAVLPASAPSADVLKQRVTLTVRETGATVNWNTIGYNPTITTTGSGASTAYYISGGDTENYAVVYSSNQLGYRADPVIPGGGGGGSSEPETPETPTTPGTPTGVESISEGSQLYTVKGAVVVSPAEPLQVAIYSVTGQTLFNDEVSYLTQVPAKAGFYVVVIQKGKERITEKVFVK